MADGWIDRQLRRVREEYERLPSWQQTAKSNNTTGPKTDPREVRPERDKADRAQETPRSEPR